jgi:hypothetical protein
MTADELNAEANAYGLTMALRYSDLHYDTQTLAKLIALAYTDGKMAGIKMLMLFATGGDDAQ